MKNKARLSEALVTYEGHLKAKGMAANTIKNSCQPLRRGLAVWGDIPVGSIDGGHIDLLFASGDWQPRTRNLYLNTLRQFFAWAVRQKMLPRDADPTEGWRNQRVPSKEKMRLPVEQFIDLLDACDHPRDRAVCALGLFTFLRGSELQTLRIEDLDLSRHELTIWRHKTKEADVLPVSVELAEEMTLWLNHYRSRAGRLDGKWWLVPAKGPNPTRINPVTRLIEVDPDGEPEIRPLHRMTHPYRAVQRALSALGYETAGEGEHTLRRSGARALFDELRKQGYDGALMRVSSMLGHKSVKVTEVYIGLGLERMQRNEALAGKVMLPSARRDSAAVRLLKEA